MDLQPTNSPSALPPMFRKPVWKKWLWPAIGLLIVVITVGGVTGYYGTKNQPATTANINTTDSTTVGKSGEQWLDNPQKLDDLKLFDIPVTSTESTPSYFDSNVSYYKVGTDTNSDLILALLTPNYPSWRLIGFFTKSPSGVYSLLKKHSFGLYDLAVPGDGSPNPDFGKYIGPTLAAGVTTDSITAYASMEYQKKISYEGVELTNDSPDYQFFVTDFVDSDRPVKELAKVNSGTIFAQTINNPRTEDNPTGFKVQQYILRLPNSATLIYQLRPNFVTDDSVPQVTWNDGTANRDAYRTDGVHSCGISAGLGVLDTISPDGLTITGKTNAGDSVYEFASADNPALQYLYKLYSANPTSEKALTLQEYRAKHAVFVWRDALKRLIVFNSTTYGEAAECGKPVIYLYPTTPTMVSVRVDAKITKSDPAYGNGWDVLAMPNGQLFTGSKSYDSLFWEGTGKLYPMISSGFVVSQADLAQTLTSQLHQLGLNNKESADFLDFWLPKMPTTPYVRVTWFGKNQMDQLAPLTISPKPDTTIRIFMDFEGMNQPIAISPQRLSAPARRGFTVVEWGGLLRNSTVIR